MNNSDFTESQGENSKITGTEDLSFEAKKFFTLMEEKVHMVEEHYCVSLPLRDPYTMLPNNLLQAVNRSQFLQTVKPLLKAQLTRDMLRNPNQCHKRRKFVMHTIMVFTTRINLERLGWCLTPASSSKSNQ